MFRIKWSCPISGLFLVLYGLSVSSVVAQEKPAILPVLPAGELVSGSNPVRSNAAREILLISTKLSANGEYEAAENSLRGLLAGMPKDDLEFIHEIQRGIAICLINETSIPADRMVDLVQSWSEAGWLLRSSDDWNMGLRLTLRCVQGTEPGKKAERWHQLAALLIHSGDEKIIYPESSVALTAFLSLDSQTREVSCEDLLADLIVATPDYPSLVMLHNLRNGFLLPSLPAPPAPVELQVKQRWNTIAINLPNVAEVGAQIHLYAASRSSIDEKVGDWGDPYSVYKNVTTKPAPGLNFDPYLVGRAESELTVSKEQKVSPRRLSLLCLYAGHQDEAIEHAVEAVLSSKFSDAEMRLKELDTVAVCAGGSLLDARLAESSLFYELDVPSDSCPGLPTDRKIYAAVSAAVRANRKSMSTDDHPTGTVGSSDRARLMQLSQDRKSFWADWTLKMAQGAIFWTEPKTAMALWTTAINNCVDYPSARKTAEGLESALASLNNLPQELDIMAIRDHGLSTTLQTDLIIQLLQARMLYKAGEFQKSIDTDTAIARAFLPPDLVGASQLEVGVLRATTLIKLGKKSEAEQLLTDLRGVRGNPEDEGQVLFLQGWFHLSRNEQDAAQELFQQVVDLYPGTAIAKRTQEIIAKTEVLPDFK